ncbi:PDZ domain-containing protein [Piscinibacter sakaiensis]|uniref:PDZ domain-containing protein n=1 Tax=Piscinibacter sakaiensis TaxID=1547922 RepID=UPI003727CDAD
MNAPEKRQADVAQGLLVEDVGGPAARAGIEAGDVLLAINGRAVDSVAQVREQLKAHPKQVALLLLRDGNRIFVPVKLG